MRHFLIALAISWTFAQPAASGSPTGWLARIVNTEERLIHREQVGPYLVSADGQRLIDDPYLKLDLRYEGERIPPESDVQVDAALYHEDEIYTASYIPEVRDELFVIRPLELPGAETWSWDSGGRLELTFFVDGPAGEGRGRTSFRIYPPKPETGRLFGLINFGIPFILLAIFAVIYRLRRVRLQRYGR